MQKPEAAETTQYAAVYKRGSRTIHTPRADTLETIPSNEYVRLFISVNTGNLVCVNTKISHTRRRELQTRTREGSQIFLHRIGREPEIALRLVNKQRSTHSSTPRNLLHMVDCVRVNVTSHGQLEYGTGKHRESARQVKR